MVKIKSSADIAKKWEAAIGRVPAAYGEGVSRTTDWAEKASSDAAENLWKEKIDEAAAAKYVLFGDFSKYVIRTIGGMNLIRMNERFADSLTSGFLAWERIDADLVASDAPIKYVYRTAT